MVPKALRALPGGSLVIYSPPRPPQSYLLSPLYVLFNAGNVQPANKVRHPPPLTHPQTWSLLCSQPGRWGCWHRGRCRGGWRHVHGVMLSRGASLSPGAVGKAPVHPVLQGRTNWEAMRRVAGQGGGGGRDVPHTPSPRGGTSPSTHSTPPPTPFPRLCLPPPPQPWHPRPMGPAPPAGATPCASAAPMGALGWPHPSTDQGSCRGGGQS